MTPQEAADRVDVMLRHCDLLPSEIDAVTVLRDHARADLRHEDAALTDLLSRIVGRIDRGEGEHDGFVMSTGRDPEDGEGWSFEQLLAAVRVASCGVTSKGPASLPADSYLEQER